MRAVVLGYHAMGCVGLDALLRCGFEVPAVLTHRDNPNEEIWWPSLAGKARDAGIPVHYPETMKDPGVQSLLARLHPDFLFSFYFRFMIPPDILGLASGGALNLHGSLLPRYRGRAPVNWVLVNGEKETGVSLHYMVAKPDAGDLVDQERVAIDFDDTPRVLYDKLLVAAEVVLARTLPLLREGHAPRIKMDLSKGSYYGGRKPQDGLIQWARPATDIFYLIRGVTHPYPGAFTYFMGGRLFVWWAWPVESEKETRPGMVLNVDENGFDVSTGKGRLRVLTCQLEDGPELDAPAFCSRYGLEPGALLGEN